METNGDSGEFKEPAMMEDDGDAGGKSAKKGGSKKRLSVERIYQKKTQLEHILLRPDTYIGSVEHLTQCEEGGGGDEDGDGAPKEKRRYKPTTFLSKAQEQALVDWFSEQPMFFDQHDIDFRSRQRKDELLDEKAKEFGLTGIELWVWFKSQRTIYGRINKQKCLRADKSLTGRQKWVLDNFAFLKDHIVVRNHDTKNAMSKIPLLSPNAKDEADDGNIAHWQGEAGMEQTSCSMVNMGANYSNPSGTADEPGSSKQYHHAPGLQRNNQTNDAQTNNALMTLVQNLVSENRAIHSKKEVNPRTAWTQWMGEELKDIPEALWTQFQKESFSMVMKFKDLSQSQEVPFSSASAAANDT